MGFYKLGFAALAASLHIASASLENNIAYRSPSLNVRSLEIPLDTVQANKLAKRGEAEYFGGNLTFDYSVASGDPTADSVILWTKADKYDDPSSYYPVCVNWEVAKKNFTSDGDIVASGQAHTTHEVDYTVKVEATGLEPFTKYFYRFYNCVGQEAGTSDVGVTKTLPAKGDVPNKFNMAVFSCSNYPVGFFNAYGNAANKSEEIDLVQHLGDYIYEYKAESEIGRVPAPNREIVTLADYRDRIATYRTDPDLKKLHQLAPWNMIWDDHEVADNTYNGGSANSNNTAQGEINGIKFSERKANAVRAYFEWSPIRQIDTDDELRIWRSFQVGDLADIILLDTRQYERDITDIYYNTDEIEKIADSPDRTLLGEKQTQWFLNELSKSQDRGATWKIIGSQVIFSPLNQTQEGSDFDINYDAWDGYTHNRDQVLTHLEEQSIDNSIFLIGDTHANWVFDVPPRDYKEYDAKTGKGSVAVEFGVTAVSSSSSYGSDKTDEEYLARAEQLVGQNDHLKFAEGNLRGYFELELTPKQAAATYYGFKEQNFRNSDVTELATLVVEKDTNAIKRPFNGGKAPKSGAFGVEEKKNKRYNKEQF